MSLAGASPCQAHLARTLLIILNSRQARIRSHPDRRTRSFRLYKQRFFRRLLSWLAWKDSGPVTFQSQPLFPLIALMQTKIHQGGDDSRTGGHRQGQREGSKQQA